jgi:hypothetical protein
MLQGTTGSCSCSTTNTWRPTTFSSTKKGRARQVHSTQSPWLPRCPAPLSRILCKLTAVFALRLQGGHPSSRGLPRRRHLGSPLDGWAEQGGPPRATPPKCRRWHRALASALPRKRTRRPHKIDRRPGLQPFNATSAKSVSRTPKTLRRSAPHLATAAGRTTYWCAIPRRLDCKRFIARERTIVPTASATTLHHMPATPNSATLLQAQEMLLQPTNPDTPLLINLPNAPLPSALVPNFTVSPWSCRGSAPASAGAAERAPLSVQQRSGFFSPPLFSPIGGSVRPLFPARLPYRDCTHGHADDGGLLLRSPFAGRCWRRGSRALVAAGWAAQCHRPPSTRRTRRPRRVLTSCCLHSCAHQLGPVCLGKRDKRVAFLLLSSLVFRAMPGFQGCSVPCSLPADALKVPTDQ